MTNKATRNDIIIELSCTSTTTNIMNITTLPPVGQTYHDDIVYIGFMAQKSAGNIEKYSQTLETKFL